MRKLFSSLIVATLGLWLSVFFKLGASVTLLPDSAFFGFHLTALWQLYLLFGIILGLLAFFAKPMMGIIIVPLSIFLLDAIFREFSAPPFLPLLWTTLSIWCLNFIISII